jgi:pimeloyl-ACP methyl ester carboxylesterase
MPFILFKIFLLDHFDGLSSTIRITSPFSYANFLALYQVIGEPVYIVGNSLGGFVALYLAASSPHLVKGVTLLNATPFWGFLPNPSRSPHLSKIFPWAGTFPLPSSVRKLTETVYVLLTRFRIHSSCIILKFLDLSYVLFVHVIVILAVYLIFFHEPFT